MENVLTQVGACLGRGTLQAAVCKRGRAMPRARRPGPSGSLEMLKCLCLRHMCWAVPAPNLQTCWLFTSPSSRSFGELPLLYESPERWVGGAEAPSLELVCSVLLHTLAKSLFLPSLSFSFVNPSLWNYGTKDRRWMSSFVRVVLDHFSDWYVWYSLKLSRL